MSKVIFDTRSKWTGVVVASAVDSDGEPVEFRSGYALDTSQTQITYKPNG